MYKHVEAVNKRIADHDDAALLRVAVGPVCFASLAQDLKSVWTAPATDARLKKRIVRTVIQEAIADLDDATGEIIITIHWVGGVHTEHRLPRRRRGQRNSTPANIIEAVGQLALVAKDDVIAGLLNRNGINLDRQRQSMDPREGDFAPLEEQNLGASACRRWC